MKHVYATLLLIAPIATLAQPFLPGVGIADTVSIPCPQDSTRMILTYAGWEAYQTVNDVWDGPRDTTVCMDLAYLQGQWVYPRIAVDQIQAQRPVFVRARYDSLSVLPLSSNDQYVISVPAYSNSTFDTGPCPGGPCTGLIGAVRIPDVAGTGTDLRWYSTACSQSDFYPLELCLPTEKFATNDLREFIMSFKLIDPQPGQFISGIYPDVLDQAQMGNLVRLPSAEVPNHLSGPFNYQFGFDGVNYLVMHPDTMYPDAEHVGYLDFSPIPNVAVQSEVTVSLEMYSGFNFQPFTQLRGGLLLGSDSIHHPLTVVNNGAELCMGWDIAELVWGPGDRYVHQAGHVEFRGKRTCFLFHAGSTLEIPDGSTLHYGYGGRGMLALMNGSNLVIGNGGELKMQGMLVIKEAPGTLEHEDMYVTLGEGARLRFAPGSRIYNANSIEGRMQLVVTLDGGSIDVTGLSPEDRAKVRVVELPREPLTEVRMLGNPISEAIVLDFASRSNGAMSVRCMDAIGRPVWDRPVAVNVGPNRLNFTAGELVSGAYIMELRLGAERQVVRFVKE